MEQNTQTVTFQGNPLTLVGNEIKIGDKMPDAELTSNDMKTVRLSSMLGKLLVLLSVPSLDTAVCDMEARRFNKEAASLGKDVQIVVISMDLPFAQARWCGAAGATQLKTLSDYRGANFGMSFGVLINELKLLARTVFIVGKDGTVKYIQRVKEITNEPNYDEVLKAVGELNK